MPSTSNPIGKPTTRIDGHAKVIGAARYAADVQVPNLCHGYVVSSAIAKGRIVAIDTHDACEVPGVVRIFTHENRPGTARPNSDYQDDVAPASGSPFRPLRNDKIVYSGQPVALVVAEEPEIAAFAASLIRIAYEAEQPVTDPAHMRTVARKPRGRNGNGAKPRGNAEKAFASAAIGHEAEYWSPVEYHNPMETHATTVVWERDDRITVYDKTQGVQNSQRYVAHVFGYAEDKVRVLAPYVGGAFGSGLRPQYQLFLAVMAARALKRSVRVALTRQQMFTFGYRPGTLQRVALGAQADGRLSAIIHDALAMTSHFEDYKDGVVEWSGLLYRCDNTRFSHRLASLDVYTPMDMRAPGGAEGMFALECAMDELAHHAGMDPIELRLRNYTDKDQNEDQPYSSKELRACYRQGAEAFGWQHRRAVPRSMHDGTDLVGWGMATGIWEAMQQKTSAKAILTQDGKLEVSSATADIGPGTYTMMAQIAAGTLGLPLQDVTVGLGDSTLPDSPVEGGSWTAASVGSAVQAACEAVGRRLLRLAQQANQSPLAGAAIEEVTFDAGRISLNSDPSHNVSIVDAMRYAADGHVVEKVSAAPPRHNRHSAYAHSAVFVEVKVDEELGVVRVTRVVNAVAAGRILNPMAARSQVIGGVVWGIGMALEEEALTDHHLGRVMNRNLAEYHVPVNADIHAIDVIFIEEHDDMINPLGVKGLGEIGIVGTAAAIANAVYHATGKRVRDLPITLDKLLT